MNFQSQNSAKSKLLTNKILIIILSVALIGCLTVLVFFIINSNKKNSTPETPKEEIVASSESTSSSKTENSSGTSSSDSSVSSTDSNEIKLTTDYSSWNSTCSPELVLVNANNKLPDSYKVDISNYCEVKINSIISAPLNKMIADARTQKKLNLWLSSSYRDIETQTRLYQQEVKDKLAQGHPQQKAEDLAAQSVARPGYSEHNTGLAVDFNGVKNNFKETDEYKWLVENSYKYGFVLRYPEEKKDLTGIIYEPWHFRFVGVEVATEMKEKNLCFEEYVSSR